MLIDDVLGVDHVLSDADTRGEASGSRSVAAFDADGRHMVYARRLGGVAVRTLATQSERAVPVAELYFKSKPSSRAHGWSSRIFGQTSSIIRLRGRNSFENGRHGYDANSGHPISPTIAPAWLRADTGEIVTKRPELPRRNVDRPRGEHASFGGQVLSGEPGSYQITNTKTGEVTALPGVHGHVEAQSRSTVAIDRVIVDLETSRVLGEVSQLPVAVDSSCRALVPASCDTCDVAMGPLHWELPEPRASSHEAAWPGALFPPQRPSATWSPVTR